MCFSLPGKISKIIDSQEAEVVQNKEKRKIKTALVNNLEAGDWVLINANMATRKITPSEAREINNMFNNIKS